MTDTLVPMLKKQSRLQRQPNGLPSGLSTLLENAVKRIEDLECCLALAESIADANSDATRELLKINKENKKLSTQISYYQQAINEIDDWFEYANESKSDREKVHSILDALCHSLGRMGQGRNNTGATNDDNETPDVSA